MWGDSFQTYGFPAEGGSAELLTPAMLDYRETMGPDDSPSLDLESDTVKPGMSGGACSTCAPEPCAGSWCPPKARPARTGAWPCPGGLLAARLAEVTRPIAASRRRPALVHRRPARPPPGALPPAPGGQGFTGRGPELAAVEEGFTANFEGVVIQAVTGLAVVGKTQLAARYVTATETPAL